ncbi:class I SAM-dependent methyltransferase [Aquimarina intermedia]|uniref:Methyltransferase family protein n=1 Tax=Aquimarina intermedia TaxID=350814 RepID=A0A5S5C4P2_9FLAO|nr:class I SAM-dependent methyltransferase [Aquimarina intermedia]TYP74395.1 methyltransferase family protein [Aquimarina intermedia]
MHDNWTKKWDDRYEQEAYAYGVAPNVFLKDQLPKLKPGVILFGAEGEGRNAVYTSKLGWDVKAFDISEQGRKKALQLAEESRVTIDYQVGLLPQLDFQNASFDAIALFYAHFPPKIKSGYHKILDKKLKRGGF